MLCLHTYRLNGASLTDDSLPQMANKILPISQHAFLYNKQIKAFANTTMALLRQQQPLITRLSSRIIAPFLKITLYYNALDYHHLKRPDPMRYIRHTLSLAALLPLTAIAADKHVHGEAELFIAIEGKQILIEFESPADNILGFEHAPKTKKQRELLESSLDKLKSHRALISVSGAACEQVATDVESPFADHDEDHHQEHNHDEHKHEEHHGEHKHDEHHDEHDEQHHKEQHAHHDHHDEHDHGDHKDDGHSDFHASYKLVCDKNVAETLTATINAFETFSGFEKIQVNWVTPDKQGASTATPAKTLVAIGR